MQIISRKRWIGQEYSARLADLKGLQLPVEEPWPAMSTGCIWLVLSEEMGMDGCQFAQKLKKRGIKSRPFFLGMHEQPVFHERGPF